MKVNVKWVLVARSWGIPGNSPGIPRERDFQAKVAGMSLFELNSRKFPVGGNSAGIKLTSVRQPPSCLYGN